MKPKINKRTLKKKIRRIISLCILLSIMLFSGIIITMSAALFRTQAVFFSSHFASNIVESISSEFFLDQLGISGLEDFDPSSPNEEKWLDYFSKVADNFTVNNKSDSTENTDVKENEFQLSNIDSYILRESVMSTTIELKGKIIYSNLAEDCNMNTASDSMKKEKGLFNKLFSYYANTKSSVPLYSSSGETIGKVTVSFDTKILFIFTIILAIVILFIGLFALVVAGILSRFLTIPVTHPLLQLNDKIRAIAAGELETVVNQKVLLRKPLQEVEALADSTNIIMHKMKDYSDKLNRQNMELELKNDELEAQNEELFESRGKIEEQWRTLENQNLELEAQNMELVDQKKKIEEQQAILENQNNELESQNEELIESRKQIQEAQTQVVQSGKMASIGQLTAAITHEINTPLGAINSNVQMCDMLTNLLIENDTLKSDPDSSALLAQIRESNGVSILACKRVMEIIKSLKVFSRLDQAEFQEADINEGIRSVLVLTSNLWKHKAAIHESYGDIPIIKCFPGLLNQVFMNILVNGIQAIEDKGEIYISTSLEGDNVLISIRDSGCGISQENLDKIFDNGFTTKAPGIGMGLGLSISQSIIKKHFGEISVKSEFGKGAEFIIRIPAKN